MAKHDLRDPTTGRYESRASGIQRMKAESKEKARESRWAEKGRMGHAMEEGDETDRFDLGPWAETPASSRVSAYRYDYLNQAIQVTWRNNKNHGYIYEDRSYEQFRSFARAVSKGKYINVLGPPYRLMDPEEVQAPSNERRVGIQSRVRG